MKLIYQSERVVRQSIARAKREESRRVKHRIWLKNKRRKHQGIPKYELTKINSHNRSYWDYEHVKAPDNFSLICNHEEVIKFISIIENNFNSNKKVFVILRNVINIDYGAIVVLLSIMVKFSTSKISFDGDFPRDNDIKHKLAKSGFFDNLFRTFEYSERYEIHSKKKDSIYTHAYKSVDSDLGAKIISAATETIWGETRRCQGVQRALVELMQNTNNHASIEKQGEKHWWLSVNHDKTQHKVSFSFVDFGVGVFKSLDNKGPKSKFHEWTKKIFGKLEYKNNADLLRLIFEGKLHQTVTGKPYRGKGLPGIAEAEKRNQLSHLIVITNNVYADVENEMFKLINIPFNGTFVYWELGESNESCK